MNRTSTIQSTRKGFFYQDSYAVFCYLKNLALKNIKRFFADYPEDKQRSLDILFLDANERANIYEIKSGDCFPDKIKELKEALISLHTTWFNKKNASLNLIIRKGYRKKILVPWGHVQTLNENRALRSDKAKESSEYIKDLLSLKSVRDGHLFCQALNLDSEYDDCYEYNCDQHPPLVDASLRIISDLSPKFKAEDCNFEYPDEILIFRLLNELIRFAGTKTDLHPRFSEIIINFFTRRRLFAEYYQGVKAKHNKEEKIREEVKAKFEAEFLVVQGQGIASPTEQESDVVK